MKALITIEDQPTQEDPKAVHVQITASEELTTKTTAGRVVTKIKELLKELQNDHS